MEGEMVGRERLTQMYKDWQGVLMRLEMAKNTLKGAELEATKQEARFKGAVEMLAGPEASWTYDVQKGVTVSEGPSVAPPTPLPSENGTTVEPSMEIKQTDEHGNFTVVQLPQNRAKRKRALRAIAERGVPSAIQRS